MVNAVQVSKLRGEAVGAPPQAAVVVSKLRAPTVFAPPQDDVSLSKLRAPVVFAPPQNDVSVSKLRAYAVLTRKVIIVPDFTWPTPSAVGPEAALVPRRAKANLVPYNISGGQGFTNVEQIMGTTPGRWRLDLADIRVKTQAQRLMWEALEFGLRGRSKTVLMPIYRWHSGLVPWPVDAGGNVLTSAPDYQVQVIRAFCFAQALEGSSSITIRWDYGGTLKAGHIFGTDAGKIYAVTEITATGTTGSSPAVPTYTCTIAPPLRERIEALDRLNFDNPTLRCRLAEDTSMAVDGGWDFWKHGTPSLTFWEDVTTPGP